MYEPVFNSLTGYPSTVISASNNLVQVTEQTQQPVRNHPPVIHRCVSTPYLGTVYNATHDLTAFQYGPTCLPNHTSYFLSQQHGVSNCLQNDLNSRIHFTCDTNCGVATVVPRHNPEMAFLGSADGLGNKHFEVKKEEKQDPTFDTGNKSLGFHVYARDKNGGAHQMSSYDLLNASMINMEKEEENKRLRLELEAAEKRILTLEQQINDKESERKKQQQLMHSIDAYMTQKEDKCRRMHKHLEKYMSKENTEFKNGRKDDLRDWGAEHAHLLSEISKAREELFLEVASKKYLHQTLHREITELKFKLENECHCTIRLSEEIKNKDKKIEDLKREFREHVKEKNSLLENVQELREQVNSYEENYIAVEGRKYLQKQLLKEMVSAISQIKNLVEFCVRDHHGEDMNVSLIIGTRAHPVLRSSEEFSNIDEMLTYQVQEVKKIKDEIKTLQETLSNNYAARVGSQLVL